ncbi:hypothetical protein GUH33_19025, partial [Xanthomonas citri pv. citri]|nr:hypothetical protein [Xanthomonas citri pv. citri]
MSQIGPGLDKFNSDGIQCLDILPPARLQAVQLCRGQSQSIELALLSVGGLARLHQLAFQPGVAGKPLAVFPVELH